MPVRESEALILRSYPFREADVVVSFFTRDRGKLRGIANGVRRPKNNRFGVALERMAHSRVVYMQKENAELVGVRRAELVGPANLWKADYPASVMLDIIAETSDRILPDSEVQDAYFRLLRLIVEEFQRGIRGADSSGDPPAWAHRALVYFLLWSARLGGWLPPLDRCIESDTPFAPDETAYFSAGREGLFRAEFKDPGAWRIPPESRTLALRMLKSRPDQFDDSGWPTAAAFELQRFLLQRTQAQLESRLRGTEALQALWSDPEPATGG